MSSRLRSASVRKMVIFLTVMRVVAHPSGHAGALEDLARVRAGTDRAGLAVRVGTVRLRAAAEVVALDRSGEALALRDAADIDYLALFEERHVERLADLVLGDVVEPELARVLDPRQVLQLAQARLGQLLGRARAELDGAVAVALGRAQRRSPYSVRPRPRTREPIPPSAVKIEVMPTLRPMSPIDITS